MSFLIRVVDAVFELMYLALLLRVLLSWLPNLNRGHAALRLLDDLTEPILAPLRRVLPLAGPLDLSPLIAYFLLRLLHRVVLGVLAGLPGGTF